MADSDTDERGYPFVWLWDAGAHAGVAGGMRQAEDAAAEYIADAGTATVEKARLACGPDLLTVHERTGVGATATMRNGRVSWSPLRAAA